MTTVVKFEITVDFVERVNNVMIHGKPANTAPAKVQPVRVRNIISSTKQSESEMRSKYSEALRVTSTCSI